MWLCHSRFDYHHCYPRILEHGGYLCLICVLLAEHAIPLREVQQQLQPNIEESNLVNQIYPEEQVHRQSLIDRTIRARDS